MAGKYIVRLSVAERQMLEELVRKGKTQAYRIKHANILLAADAEVRNWKDEQIATAYGCHVNTVANVRQRFVELGLDGALERKKQETPSRQRILDGEKEARLITVACSEAPEGQSRWTLELLANELVTLQVVESISKQTVRRTLKKTNLSRTCAAVG